MATPTGISRDHISFAAWEEERLFYLSWLWCRVAWKAAKIPAVSGHAVNLQPPRSYRCTYFADFREHLAFDLSAGTDHGES
ncbi:hypothetical protein [Komagataeibacter kakiaceti]|uniref:hypothetical protein n=1 Tax=Komagataeibacter kakiaceti TaxID=943261 RepID=UPI00046FD01B|nr:hypothetical protein [Komagataeibacter kakiaceti]